MKKNNTSTEQVKITIVNQTNLKYTETKQIKRESKKHPQKHAEFPHRLKNHHEEKQNKRCTSTTNTCKTTSF